MRSAMVSLASPAVSTISSSSRCGSRKLARTPHITVAPSRGVSRVVTAFARDARPGQMRTQGYRLLGQFDGADDVP